MATPSLTKHSVPGALGEILVDVRSGGRSSPRPAVIVLHILPNISSSISRSSRRACVC